MEEKSILSLQDIAGGALQEKAQQAIKDVVENMQDPNTPWKNKREVVIKLAFSQNEDRDDAACEISVSKKLAQAKPIKTTFCIGKDLINGRVYIEEYGPQIKGQMSISDFQEPKQVIGTDLVDTGTGEVVATVVDMRAAREA